MKKSTLLLPALILMCFNFSLAQSIWKQVGINEIKSKIGQGTKEQLPSTYMLYSFSLSELKSRLVVAPEENFETINNSSVSVAFPFEDGHLEDFTMKRVYYLNKELSVLYPEIQSYVGVSRQNPLNKVYVSFSGDNFYGVINGEKTIYLDPYKRGVSDYVLVYNRKLFNKATDDDFSCAYIDEENSEEVVQFGSHQLQRNIIDGKFRTYDIAIACTSEYSAYHGNTVASVLAAMNTTMTRVNSVFERDMGLRFQIVPANNRLIYINGFNSDATPDSDPYDNYSGTQMLGANTANISGLITADAYDIGHVFSTGGGGVASTSPCGTNKGAGVTGIVTPEFDPFDIDYVAHEIGHQFSAGHTYYNPCFGSKVSDDYEPGSASTILGYAGICAPNVQANSDGYFHARSIAQMTTAVNSHTCETETTYTNVEPTANAGADYTIPRNTPFILNGNLSSDPTVGDVLTYCWEQYDANDGGVQPPASTNTAGPVFRSFFPTTNPARVFPNMEAIIANQTPTWEVLPSVARTLNFRLTVRDNNAQLGQTNSDNVVITVNSTGPFVVNSPNLGTEVWYAGETKTVTWAVNSTNTLSANVNIKLSLDGGFTYPITLLSNTLNDGTQAITVPNNVTKRARVKIEAATNIFFDISNQDFEIKAGTFEFVTTNINIPVCKPNVGSFTFNYVKAPNFSELVTFSMDNLPVGVSASFLPNSLSANGLVTVTLTGAASVAAGSYPVVLKGTSTNATETIPVSLNVYEDFIGQLTLNSPVNGATNLATSVLLKWNTLPSAEDYIVELSESPLFSIIAETITTSKLEYQTTSLVEGKIYFWRVRPKNTCIYGSYSEIYSFQISRDFCNTYTNEYFEGGDNIWNTNSNNAVSARMDVADNLIISKVTFYMRATHPLLSDIKMQFRAPNGIFSEIYNRDCSGANFNVTFDDAGIPLTCGNVDPGVVAGLEGIQQPGQSFSRFIGSNAQGTWNLLATDRVSNTSGGTFNEFSITICGKLQVVNNIALVKNALTVNQGVTQNITSAFLNATQTGATTAQLQYTITKLPTNGYLLLNGQRLFVGDSFTQANINSVQLSYKHNALSTTADSFVATIKGNNLALLGGQVFTINITPQACAVSTTWNGATWSNGTPDKNKNVIFNGNFTTAANLEACTVQVNGTAVLTITSGTNITVNRAVSINSSANIIVQNNANLIQVEHMTNTGVATVNRNSSPIVRLDYTLWSSPVANQNLLAFSPQTVANRFYVYNPLTGTNGSYDAIIPSSNDFIPTKGYLVRAPNNWSSTVYSPYSGVFRGTFNNAYFKSVIKKGTSGYNAIGNPYPSTISANDFILKNTFNRGTENQTIDGTLYFWTHTQQAVSGTYPLNNYATYTLLGGTASAAGGAAPNGTIQVGQGFIVNAVVPSYVSFSNEMRLANNGNQFFRAFNPSAVTAAPVEKHRIWVNLKNQTGQFSQVLVGYMSEATNDYDFGIDGLTFGNQGSNLYSIVAENKYAVQGRVLPFTTEDIIPLGVVIVEPDIYEIELEAFDGLFAESQNIYLKDKVLNVVHDLKIAAYTFNTTEATLENRFEIVFKNEALSNNLEEISNLTIHQSDNHVYVKTANDEIEQIEVYDLLGRRIFYKTEINESTFNFSVQGLKNQVLAVKLTTKNKGITTTKILTN